jgi:hypothetical protein
VNNTDILDQPREATITPDQAAQLRELRRAQKLKAKDYILWWGAKESWTEEDIAEVVGSLGVDLDPDDLLDTTPYIP